MIPLAGWTATGTKLGKKVTGITYDLIHRSSKGVSGGISRHVLERLDGDVFQELIKSLSMEKLYISIKIILENMVPSVLFQRSGYSLTIK